MNIFDFRRRYMSNEFQGISGAVLRPLVDRRAKRKFGVAVARVLIFECDRAYGLTARASIMSEDGYCDVV